jgi:hypothetical protein
MPQHRHPVTKKAKKNGFFVPLGCLELHEINNSIGTQKSVPMLIFLEDCQEIFI